ncbi:MAG: extracellular solute-binding protein [Chthoniobacterales bacterium]
MNIFTKTFFLIACMGLLAGGLQAQDTTPHKKVTLRVFGLSIANPTARDSAEWNVVQVFRKRFPWIELESAQGIRVEGVGDEVGPLMMIAGGIAPDVLRLNFHMMDGYVRQGFLYPLDEFIDKERAKNPAAFNNRLLPSIEKAVKRKNPDGSTHYYAMPTKLLFTGLYYNKALFEKAGLPMRAPLDWKELEEFCRKIQASTPGAYGLVLLKGGQASWHLMNFLWSAGGDVVKEVKPGEWTAVFNSPQAAEGYEFYYKLVEEKLATRLDEQFVSLSDPHTEEKTGMIFGYIGDVLSRDPNKWSFGPVPTGPTGLRGAEVNANLYGMFSGVKDPELRQAAWEFINFMGSDEAQRIRVQSLIDVGSASTVNPLDLKRFGFSEYLQLTQPGLVEDFTEAVKTAQPEPYGKGCDVAYVEMTYPLDEILHSPEIATAWKDGNKKEVRAEIQKILDRAVAITNERMIGYIAPQEMRKRRIVATIVVSAIVLFFLIVGFFIIRTFQAVGAATARTRGKQIYLAWLILLPALLLMAMWSYFPLLRGIVIAVLDYQLVLKSTFVGIDNFAIVLFDSRFWESLVATVHYAAWMLTIGFFTPIGLAYLLHITPRGTIIYRTVYYIPALLTGTAVFVLWKNFFSPTGLMNTFLNLVHIPLKVDWTDDPALAMISCVLPTVWASAGPGCLIYLAALKTIPEEQFEAAEIDGAGFFAKTRDIIYPALKPLILINLIGAFIVVFQTSQNILLMTAGGPNRATEVTSLKIFYEAFFRLQFGTSTAMAWIIGSILVGFSIIQLRRLSQMEFKTAK